jgi:hypothetical protein
MYVYIVCNMPSSDPAIWSGHSTTSLSLLLRIRNKSSLTFPPDDVYLIKLQREVLQNLISTRRMQISQISGMSKENTHKNNKSYRYNRTAQL